MAIEVLTEKQAAKMDKFIGKRLPFSHVASTAGDAHVRLAHMLKAREWCKENIGGEYIVSTLQGPAVDTDAQWYVLHTGEFHFATKKLRKQFREAMDELFN